MGGPPENKRKGFFGKDLALPRIRRTDGRRKLRANDQSAYTAWPGRKEAQERFAGAAGKSRSSGCLHARVHGDAEKAQLGSAEGCPSPPHQRYRGHLVHSGNRPQPAGALGGSCSWRKSERPSRSQVSHYSGNTRLWRRGESKEIPLQVRRPETQVGFRGVFFVILRRG